MSKSADSRLRRAVSVSIEALEDRRLLSAVLTLQNLDVIPSNTRLVFNRIQNPNPSVNDIVHDTDTLRLRNTGDQPLTISSVALSDTTNWQLVNPPSGTLTIAPGGSRDLTVQFIAQSVPPHSTNETNNTMTADGTPVTEAGGVWNGNLTINSNDPSNPTQVVQLAGYWQKDSEHEDEPGLATQINLLFGYTTDIGNPANTPDLFNNGTTPVLYGDEVASPYWQAADPSKPVFVRELGAFHNQLYMNTSQILTAFISWFPQSNSSATHTIFTHAQREGQSLLPHIAGSSTAPAQGSFTPGGPFGWDVDSEFSVDSLNTTDINTYQRSGHAVRFYPLKDANGQVVPNTWIIAMDLQNGPYDNFDYQDALYLASNVQPLQGTQQTPPPTTTPGSFNPTLAGDFGALARGLHRVRGSVMPENQVAFYKFTLAASARINLGLVGLRNDADLELLDSSGNVISSSMRPRRLPEHIARLLAAGTYYVRVNLVASKGTPYLLAILDRPVPVKHAKPHVTVRR